MIFKLDKKELEIAEKWWTNHRYGCKFYDSRFDEVYAGAMGGAMTYTFTPTGLGTLTELKCICGESVSLTDMEGW